MKEASETKRTNERGNREGRRTAEGGGGGRKTRAVAGD